MTCTFLLSYQIAQPDTEQKCNAKRPCSTCIKGKNVSECVYDDEDYYLPGLHIGGAGTDMLNQTPLASGATRVAITNEPAALRVLKLESSQIPQDRSPGLTLIRGNSFKHHTPLDSSPSVSIVSSFFPPTIPPEPWVSLSSLGEDKFQVQFSKTDVTDLDMKLCVSGISGLGHGLTLGY